MTLQEYKNLPSTRKGLEKLSNEFTQTNNVFYNEVSRALRTHLQLPASVKKVVGKFNFEEYYNKIVEIKNQGYAKHTTLPF